MSKNIQTNRLFVASCLALLVTSLSFGIRAGVLSQQGIDFQLTNAQLGTIAATAFWGFPLAMLVGGTIVDIIGIWACDECPERNHTLWTSITYNLDFTK